MATDLPLPVSWRIATATAASLFARSILVTVPRTLSSARAVEGAARTNDAARTSALTSFFTVISLGVLRGGRGLLGPGLDEASGSHGPGVDEALDLLGALEGEDGQYCDSGRDHEGRQVDEVVEEERPPLAALVEVPQVRQHLCVDEAAHDDAEHGGEAVELPGG